MNIKKLILIFLLFGIAGTVKADTLEEKIASLSSEVDALWSKIDIDLYPIGSIYISSNATSPATFYGGTWEIYATDKQLIGVGTNGTTTYSVGDTGGSNSVSLAIANMAKHRHSLTAAGTITSTFTGSAVTTSSAGAHTHGGNFYTTDNEASEYGMNMSSYYTDKVSVSGGTITTAAATFSSAGSTHKVTPKGTVTSTFTGSSATSVATGSGTSFSIQNPYVTVYMWKRTA